MQMGNDVLPALEGILGFPLMFLNKQVACVCVLSHVWICGPMDCSPSGSSVHGIFQARILEWVAISYSRKSSQPKDRTHISNPSLLRLQQWQADSLPLVPRGKPPGRSGIKGWIYRIAAERLNWMKKKWRIVLKGPHVNKVLESKCK